MGFEPANEPHGLAGLKYLREGDHYHPDTYDESILDTKVYVATEDAYDRARDLREQSLDAPIAIADTGQYDEETVRDALRVDGQFLVGPSSGGGVQAVHELHAQERLSASDTVLTSSPR